MSKIKKNIIEVQTDELIDLLKEDSKAPETDPLYIENDVLTFVSVFNLQAGEESVKPYTLYSIYKVWSKDPVNKNPFYFEMAKLFTISSGNYKVNRNAIQITHEAYSQFKHKDRRLKSKPWTKHFEDFLLFHSIKNGNQWLEASILYFLYDKYIHQRGLDDHPMHYMSQTTFYTYADIFLKHKITKDGKVYSVSDNIKNFFQKDQLQRMQAANAKEQEEKAKPKRKRKTSKSRTKV